VKEVIGDERRREEGDTGRAAQVSLSDTWRNKRADGAYLVYLLYRYKNTRFTCFTCVSLG
jgi:hypothetical protein